MKTSTLQEIPHVHSLPARGVCVSVWRSSAWPIGASVVVGLFFACPAGGQTAVGTNMPVTGMTSGMGSPKAPVTKAIQSGEDPLLAPALAALDQEAKTMAEGPRLWEAISAQANVPVPTLKKQRSTSKLRYGDLIVANSLAARSGNRFEQIVSMRSQNKSWSAVAKQLRIDLAAITARVGAASAALKKAKTT